MAININHSNFLSELNKNSFLNNLNDVVIDIPINIDKQQLLINDNYPLRQPINNFEDWLAFAYSGYNTMKGRCKKDRFERLRILGIKE